MPVIGFLFHKMLFVSILNNLDDLRNILIILYNAYFRQVTIFNSVITCYHATPVWASFVFFVRNKDIKGPFITMFGLFIQQSGNPDGLCQLLGFYFIKCFLLVY